jgi:DNA-binding MarR family transcriptional regulator
LEATRRRLGSQSRRGTLTQDTELHLDLNHFVPAVLTWLYNKLTNESSKLYRKWYGLGVTDWRVLAYLGVQGQKTQAGGQGGQSTSREDSSAADISRFIGLDKAAISRSILMLKNGGLVDKRQFSGRRVGLQLTVAGTALYQQMLAFVLDQERALLSGFTDGEREFLLNMLHRMLKNLHMIPSLAPTVREKSTVPRAPPRRK